MRATELLNLAHDTQAERANEYDSEDGERSMPAAVAAFNAITGRNLPVSEGYMLIALVKQVRLYRAPGFHLDSAIDLVSYGSLAAEAKSVEAGMRADLERAEYVPQPLEVVHGIMPNWENAPEGTVCAVLDADGFLFWSDTLDITAHLEGGGWYAEGRSKEVGAFTASGKKWPARSDWHSKVIMPFQG
jgi:hypothetical protein